MKPNYSSNDIPRIKTEKIYSERIGTTGSLAQLPIMSQQFKKQSFVIESKHIKTRTRESFENKLKQIPAEFDAYIEKQYKKMQRQKEENLSLIIPTGFQKFIHSKLFLNFLQRIYEYMELLVEYDKKFQQIKTMTSKFQSAQRYEPGLKKLRFQTNHLQQKCKEISYIYMGILLSHGESKLIFKDQYFFQTMIYFISQILKGIFDEDVHPLMEEELNRIFRTNAFNLIKRRQEEDHNYQKYPSLKETKYDSSVQGVNRVIKRLSIHKKFNYSVQLRPDITQRLKKPLQINLTALGSVRSRSPLISSFYPSSKQKLYQFGKSARDRESLIKQTRVSNSFFSRK